MILYITTYRNSEIIVEAVEKSEQTVMDSIVNDRISLTEFVKMKLSQLQAVSHILIDIQALTDTEDEIIEAIKSLRMVYDDKKLIFVDLTRGVGDEFLAKIFAMGIYDIISESDDNTLEELIYSIDTGRKFKDSLQYQQENVAIQENGEPGIVTEKVVVRNQVITKLNNALIGIVGTHERVGTSFHAILTANYLKQQGYKIALLECSQNPVLSSYKEFFNINSNDEELFEHKKVFYYPYFDFENISSIFSENYDVIVIDFGIMRTPIMNDYLRCMKKVVLTGSQPYELEYTDKIFELEEDMIHNLHFVFRDASKQLKTMIRENMEGEKVYFTPLIKDPFESVENEEIQRLYEDFVTKTEKVEKKGWFHGLFSKKEFISI